MKAVFFMVLKWRHTGSGFRYLKRKKVSMDQLIPSVSWPQQCQFTVVVPISTFQGELFLVQLQTLEELVSELVSKSFLRH